MSRTATEGKSSLRVLVLETFVIGVLAGCFVSFLVSAGWTVFEQRWTRWAVDRQAREDALIEFAFKFSPAGEYEDLLITPLHGKTPRWVEAGKGVWESRNFGKNLPEPFEQMLGMCSVEGLVARCPVYDLKWVRKRARPLVHEALAQ